MMMRSTMSIVLAIICLSTGSWEQASAWSVPPKQGVPATTTKSRQEFLQGFVAATIALAGAPQISHAGPEVFNHQYSDPKHPNCKRIVAAKLDGTAFVSGTDGTPGCPEDGSGNVWRLPGEVDGNTILVDFSAKGGPANLKGVWDGDGIKWPDGNKWTVKN